MPAHQAVSPREQVLQYLCKQTARLNCWPFGDKTYWLDEERLTIYIIDNAAFKIGFSQREPTTKGAGK